MERCFIQACAATLLVGGVLVTTATAEPVTRSCHGKPATITGTDRAEEIVGTKGNDVIVAGDGDDFILGRGGRDTICARDGFDTVRGGGGVDLLDGGAGDDGMSGNGGRDTLLGRSGADFLSGGSGADLLESGPNAFPLLEDLMGGPGDDELFGGPGLDRTMYFDSEQAVQVDLGADTASGDGTDTLHDIEGAIGSDFDDILIGDDGSNGLSGGEGDDTIQALDSGTMEVDSDLLTGGGGDDVLEGGDGFDFVNYDAACQPIEVDLSAGTATGQGADMLSGVEGAFGSECNDVMVGNDEDNAFLGLEGDDEMDGAAGTDTAIFLLAFGPVTADLAAGSSSGPVAGSDILAGFENLWGSSDDDVLSGDDSANSILGSFGADTLAGRGGDDALDGGGGNDEADGGDGSDACIAETVTTCEQAGRWAGRTSFPWSAVAGALSAWSVAP
jgi:Ca2+-binding RTX toxin-like protein